MNSITFSYNGANRSDYFNRTNEATGRNLSFLQDDSATLAPAHGAHPSSQPETQNVNIELARKDRLSGHTAPHCSPLQSTRHGQNPQLGLFAQLIRSVTCIQRHWKGTIQRKKYIQYLKKELLVAQNRVHFVNKALATLQPKHGTPLRACAENYFLQNAETTNHEEHLPKRRRTEISDDCEEVSISSSEVLPNIARVNTLSTEIEVHGPAHEMVSQRVASSSESGSHTSAAQRSKRQQVHSNPVPNHKKNLKKLQAAFPVLWSHVKASITMTSPIFIEKAKNIELDICTSEKINKKGYRKSNNFLNEVRKDVFVLSLPDNAGEEGQLVGRGTPQLTIRGRDFKVSSVDKDLLPTPTAISYHPRQRLKEFNNLAQSLGLRFNGRE